MFSPISQRNINKYFSVGMSAGSVLCIDIQLYVYKYYNLLCGYMDIKNQT